VGRLTVRGLTTELQRASDPERAAFLPRFFKTGPGEYGEGDRFLGVSVPQLRAFARQYASLPARDAERLLDSPWHEVRLLGLLLLVDRYRRGSPGERRSIYTRYLARTDRINNWDLVDASAPGIVGAHLEGRSIAPLRRLAKSPDLWERRIAIVATQHFIRRGEFAATFEIADRLLRDRHDLIHKATGWMLREVGKRSEAALRSFLDRHAASMPRTMLRYAIERFDAPSRTRYLRIT
jgi:3-methyladenine DNA glycosylase AlkD